MNIYRCIYVRHIQMGHLRVVYWPVASQMRFVYFVALFCSALSLYVLLVRQVILYKNIHFVDELNLYEYLFSWVLADIVEVLCNMTGIPHLQFDWHPQQSMRERLNHQLSINVAPSELIISTALADILRSKDFDWKSFTIAYERETRKWIWLEMK